MGPISRTARLNAWVQSPLSGFYLFGFGFLGFGELLVSSSGQSSGMDASGAATILIGIGGFLLAIARPAVASVEYAKAARLMRAARSPAPVYRDRMILSARTNSKPPGLVLAVAIFAALLSASIFGVSFTVTVISTSAQVLAWRIAPLIAGALAGATYLFGRVYQLRSDPGVLGDIKDWKPRKNPD